MQSSNCLYPPLTRGCSHPLAALGAVEIRHGAVHQVRAHDTDRCQMKDTLGWSGPGAPSRGDIASGLCTRVYSILWCRVRVLTTDTCVSVQNCPYERTSLGTSDYCMTSSTVGDTRDHTLGTRTVVAYSSDSPYSQVRSGAQIPYCTSIRFLRIYSYRTVPYRSYSYSTGTVQYSYS